MLTERMQKRAIWQLLHTSDDLSQVAVETFDEPYKSLWLLIDRYLDTGQEPDTALSNAAQRVVRGEGGTYCIYDAAVFGLLLVSITMDSEVALFSTLVMIWSPLGLDSACIIGGCLQNWSALSCLRRT